MGSAKGHRGHTWDALGPDLVYVTEIGNEAEETDMHTKEDFV